MYVRNTPQLRVFVRNWVSKQFTDLLEADMPAATDPLHPQKLENQDRAIRILERIARLHGADAPTQSEVTVDAAPETVDKMVAALSALSGKAYSTDIFDDDEEPLDVEILSDTADEMLTDATDRVADETEDDDL